jgi:hypothetical protein
MNKHGGKNKMDWKNKKILGMPIILASIVMILAVGSMAALVNYLSNTSEVTAVVKSPLELSVSLDKSTWSNSIALGDLYGGETKEFFVKEVNHANASITTDLIIIIAEDNYTNDCAEILTLNMYGVGGAVYNITTSCAVNSDGNLEFDPFPGQVLPVGHDAEYRVEVAFKQNVVGSYSAILQHTDPTFS